MIGPRRVGQHIGDHPGQDRAVVPGLLRRRAAEPGAHLGCVGAAQHRIGLGVSQPGHERIDGRITGAPHRLGVHRQRVLHRPVSYPAALRAVAVELARPAASRVSAMRSACRWVGAWPSTAVRKDPG